MKIKLLNKAQQLHYSCFYGNSDSIFNDEGLGLKFAYEIYKHKLQEKFLNQIQDLIESDTISSGNIINPLNEDIREQFLEKFKDENKIKFLQQLLLEYDKKNTFKSFINNYYFTREYGYPHYLNCNIQIFNDSKDKVYVFSNNKQSLSDFLFEKLTSSRKQEVHNPASVFFIIGEAGAGKTATQLALAYHAINKHDSSFRNGFIPCYLDCTSISEKNINIMEIINDSIGFRNDLKDKTFFRYSPPLLLILDLNALSSRISIKEPISDEQLCTLIRKFEKFSGENGYRHKLLVSYRGNYELLKFQKNKLFEFMENIAIIWQIEALEERVTEEYLQEIGGIKSLEIMGKFLYNAKYLLRNPIILDFINLISLKKAEIGEISSKAHLYLILSREILRMQFKQWQKENLFSVNKTNDDFENILFEHDENTYSELCNKPKYILEEKAHPVDLLLQKVASEIGEEFDLLELKRKLSEIILSVKSLKYLSEDKTLTANNLIQYTLLKSQSKNRKIQFFHSSLADFYKAKSLFYDDSSGNLKAKLDLVNNINYFSFELAELIGQLARKEKLPDILTKPDHFLSLLAANKPMQGLVKVSSSIVGGAGGLFGRAIPLIGGIIGSSFPKQNIFYLPNEFISIIHTLRELISKIISILDLLENNKYNSILDKLKNIDSFLILLEVTIQNPLSKLVIEKLKGTLKSKISVLSNLSLENKVAFYDSYITRGMEKLHLKDHEGAINDLALAVEIRILTLYKGLIYYIDTNVLNNNVL